ncbi:MAG: NAD-dependent epimerase/dehydratase family protein [Gammaproteobacteria bacterium]|nr:NAD-dependent epimerase/dehydratase family protein [Gammaproteobacteria bacterium]
MKPLDTVCALPVPRRTLVTGATGFVGSAVARCLLANGFNLRLLHRKDALLDNLEGIDAERITGDLCDARSLRIAMAGCDALFHVAADYRLWARQPRALYRTNVKGSAALLRAAAGAGVGRVVYTSSVAVLHAGMDGSVADEQTPVTLGEMVGHYKRSKYLAEQAVHAVAAELGMQVVTVNPSTPIGPRDIKPTPTGKIIVDAAKGLIPVYVDTGLNVVHVDDVAEGHLQAFWHGTPGRRYVLGGENMPFVKILRLVAQRIGRRVPKIRLPHAAVWPIALIAEGWARLRRSDQEPLATLDGVRMSMKRMYFSSARAREELGYRPRPATQAIDDALDWFAKNGYLDSAS